MSITSRKQILILFILCVLDNAGYYNTKKVRAYAKSLAITLLFLPTYSPHLTLGELTDKLFIELARLGVINIDDGSIWVA
ncbi:MAG: hypothetical protein Tsb005_20850 [Gammaproteobacteria bacterium]